MQNFMRKKTRFLILNEPFIKVLTFLTGDLGSELLPVLVD